MTRRQRRNKNTKEENSKTHQAQKRERKRETTERMLKNDSLRTQT
jgi:hypothetical protein